MAVIATVIVFPESRARVEEIIKESDFSSPLLAAIYSSTFDLDVPDSALLRELVKKRGYEIPDEFFRVISEITVTDANVEEYAKIMRQDSINRQVKLLAEELYKSVTGPVRNDSPEDVISYAYAKLAEIERGKPQQEVATPMQAAMAFIEHRNMVDSGKGAVPTGFDPLDKILGGGMLRSGLYVMAGRPGMGKTTAGLFFADSIAQRGCKVLFVSLEMSVEQIEGKRVARVSGIPSDKVLIGNMTESECRRSLDALNILSKIPVVISRKPSATVADIRNMARRIDGIECIVVDYFSIITPDGVSRDEKRVNAFTKISGDLKALAKEMNIPVLVLAQLNRENAQRQDKRPQLTDLRESGAIEQDADGVIMLHRGDYYTVNENPVGPGEFVEMEMIVRKNRHGSIGKCVAAFYPATGRIVKARFEQK